MKLALLTHSVLPRGGVVHALELATALHARGHDVTLVAPVQPGQALFRLPPCRVALLPAPAVDGPLVAQVGRRIAALVDALPAVLDGHDRGGGFDLVHAHDSLNGNALATLGACGRLRAPWLRTVHHLDDFDAPELRAWQDRGWAAAAAIGCVSALWCRHFEALGLAPRRLFNGVDLARFTPQGPAAGDGRPYVLALGGVEARKNSVRLLEAFARVRQARPSLRLVVAGGASLLDHGAAARAWQAALAAHRLHEGPDGPVERLGPVADDAVAPLMRGARALAMPSLVEGFGLVALEALACGTPVLVSNRAPFTEHLAGEPQIAWCEPEDIGSIAAGLADALERPKTSTAPAVCHAHGWTRSAAAHEAWYAELLQRRHAGRAA